jgi:hypothetical protein
VAIRTGAVSGIVVLDIDPRHDGDQTIARVEAENGRLPPGRTIRTGSGGTHLYFRHPGTQVHNDAGRLIGAGVDIRGDGGYVIAPPSRHAAGGSYTVAARGGELPELPEWLVRRLEPQQQRPPPLSPARGTSSAWGRAALNGELSKLTGAKEGARNDTLNRVAFRLGQIVGAGCLEENDVEPLLLRAGLELGLREREVTGTVHSGLSAGEQSPRGPTGPDLELE